MKLHEYNEDFENLVAITASWRGLPRAAVWRDYYIVMMLQKLEQSKYAQQCVFKGGTSLSKCYPGSIERFSEDIDLTYIPDEKLSNKQYDKALKRIEKVMSDGAVLEKITEERNDRNKSSFVLFDPVKKRDGRIKLEIGSSVRPDPYEPKTVKTYIQEYLEGAGQSEVNGEFELVPVTLNTLRIERTFLDKVMSVKRHAYCRTLNRKVRHIYDVTCLLGVEDVEQLLADEKELKRLIRLTKDTDSFYLEKRGIAEGYDPTGSYAFEDWEKFFDQEIRTIYESLHEDLLYTNVKQNFDEAVSAFRLINDKLKRIGE